MNYFNLDDIFHHEQSHKITCQYNLKAKKKLRKNKKHDLPFYITEFFILNEHFNTYIDFNENELKADPCNYKLPLKYFFRFSFIKAPGFFLERMRGYSAFLYKDDKHDAMDEIERKIVETAREMYKLFSKY